MLGYINECTRIFLVFPVSYRSPPLTCNQTALTALLPPLKVGCHHICTNQRLPATQTAGGMSKLQYNNEDAHTHARTRTTLYASKVLLVLKLQETDHTNK